MAKNLNQRLDRHLPAVLSLFRCVYGLLFAGAGSISLFDWPVHSTRSVGVGAWPGWYAGVIELVAGLLIAIGLFTRAAAFIASGEMAVAYFLVHAHLRFWPILNGGEIVVANCFVFLYIAARGAGALSVDEWIERRERGAGQRSSLSSGG